MEKPVSGWVKTPASIVEKLYPHPKGRGYSGLSPKKFLVIASLFTAPTAGVDIWGNDTAIIVSLSAVSVLRERSRRLL